MSLIASLMKTGACGFTLRVWPWRAKMETTSHMPDFISADTVNELDRVIGIV
ncbi:hypothetical protein [Marinobacter sp.]|uniref:hypothetical protein n=1 Tax=Marinobacter sp. TaxID=50741 RepID=UPI00235529DD|nr:hypothetical protein [Marinobacter sp.]